MPQIQYEVTPLFIDFERTSNTIYTEKMSKY